MGGAHKADCNSLHYLCTCVPMAIGGHGRGGGLESCVALFRNQSIRPNLKRQFLVIVFTLLLLLTLLLLTLLLLLFYSTEPRVSKCQDMLHYKPDCACVTVTCSSK